MKNHILIKLNRVPASLVDATLITYSYWVLYYNASIDLGWFVWYLLMLVVLLFFSMVLSCYGVYCSSVWYSCDVGCFVVVQCGRVCIPTLTLARFMLETSLMDYAYVKCSESRLAAAALLLAMRMNHKGCWVSTRPHCFHTLLLHLLLCFASASMLFCFKTLFLVSTIKNMFNKIIQFTAEQKHTGEKYFTVQFFSYIGAGN